MKKGIGIVIGLLLVLGLAFGVREVVASHNQRQARTEKAAKMDSGSQPKASSSSVASSSQPKSKKSTGESSKTHHKAANKAAGKADGSSASTKPAKKHANQSKSSHQDKTATSNKVAVSKPKSHANKSRATKKASSKYTGKAYLKVSGYKKLFYSGNLHITKKTTAFTLLEQTNLRIKYTSSPAIYVSAIDGLKENDVKAGSGWMYSVNGKYVDKSAGDKLIKPGDKVHWYFTVNGWSPAG